jgi:uncharacterized membrane protein YebE (DUF533 family)
MDAERLIGALIEGSLGGRRGRRSAVTRLTGGTGSLINAQTLLTAAGLAWGLYETAMAGSSGGGSTGSTPGGASPGPGPASPPPLPVPPGPATPATSGADAEVRRLVRLTLSAARADGDLSLEERGRVLAQAKELGAEELVTEELRAPRPLAEITAGVTDPRLRAEMYRLAYGIVRSDDGVSGAERIYLAQLAHQLGLDPGATKRIAAEADAATTAG